MAKKSQVEAPVEAAPEAAKPNPFQVDMEMMSLLETWNLDTNARLGRAVELILTSPVADDPVVQLQRARSYISQEIARLRDEGPDE